MLNQIADLCRHNRRINSAAQYTYLHILPKLYPGRRDSLRQRELSGTEGMPCVAFICDEMTWIDFKEQCRAFFYHRSIGKNR